LLAADYAQKKKISRKSFLYQHNIKTKTLFLIHSERHTHIVTLSICFSLCRRKTPEKRQLKHKKTPN
ncbi:hypothetical protein MLF92_23275, partial [Escherichia coli]|nr:hypothetical protein [Escherichia coli]